MSETCCTGPVFCDECRERAAKAVYEEQWGPWHSGMQTFQASRERWLKVVDCVIDALNKEA